jgi:hypothetical protein
VTVADRPCPGGDLEGTVVGANYPRRRDDGAWTPNLRGFLTRPEGKEILISIDGRASSRLEPGVGVL